MTTARHLLKHAYDLIENESFDLETVRRVLGLVIRALLIMTEPK